MDQQQAAWPILLSITENRSLYIHTQNGIEFRTNILHDVTRKQYQKIDFNTFAQSMMGAHFGQTCYMMSFENSAIRPVVYICKKGSRIRIKKF